MASLKIVCLGGGIGTVNLIRGLKEYTDEITVVTSMADDGGSSGRLRRLYRMLPPGDVVSCMSAIGSSGNSALSDLLTYRFPGNRYGNDQTLEGQKMGNLILAAIYNKTRDFTRAVEIFQTIFKIPGRFYPNTIEDVTISIKTKGGKVIKGEEKIELGKYRGKKNISQVFLNPSGVKAFPGVIKEMIKAHVIVVGPGDLYTNNMPVLLVEEIREALKKSKAKKFLIVNIANKPSEAKDYVVSDYLNAFEKHIGAFPFDTVFLNSNHNILIPNKYRRYEYVKDFGKSKFSGFKVIKKDLLDESFPLYHDSRKLAKAVIENI